MATGTPLINPPRFKAPRDRNIQVRKVVCPTCRAGVDMPCMKADGTVPAAHLQHPKRRQMAVRADNLARGI